MGSLHETSQKILKSSGVHVDLGGLQDKGGTCALGDPVSPEEFQKSQKIQGVHEVQEFQKIWEVFKI